MFGYKSSVFHHSIFFYHFVSLQITCGNTRPLLWEPCGLTVVLQIMENFLFMIQMCVCLNVERLQTEVFEEQTYREDFMAKVRGQTRPAAPAACCLFLPSSLLRVL